MLTYFLLSHFFSFDIKISLNQKSKILKAFSIHSYFFSCFSIQALFSFPYLFIYLFIYLYAHSTSIYWPYLYKAYCRYWRAQNESGQVRVNVFFQSIFHTVFPSRPSLVSPSPCLHLLSCTTLSLVPDLVWPQIFAILLNLIFLVALLLRCLHLSGTDANGSLPYFFMAHLFNSSCCCGNNLQTQSNSLQLHHIPLLFAKVLATAAEW